MNGEREFTPATITGADVVRAAHIYRGVRYRHQGTTARGLDCSGLAERVGKDTGQIPDEWHRPPYTTRPDRRLFALMLQWVVPVAVGAEQPGDLMLMTHDAEGERAEQHLAFKTDLGMLHIHPGSSLARVVEHSFAEDWQDKLLAYYRFKGVV